MGETCFICGNETLEVKSGEFRFEPPENIPGGTILIEDAQWEECISCHERVLPPELLSQLDEVRYQRLGLLKPEEIRAVRQRAGLTQKSMAHILNLGEKTYTRWETGRSLQNKSSDNLIRLFDRNAASFVKVESQRAPDRDEKIANYFDTIGEIDEGNQQAIAAHGSELNPEMLKQLCERLLELDRCQKEEQS